jgi:hypothetical protein
MDSDQDWTGMTPLDIRLAIAEAMAGRRGEINERLRDADTWTTWVQQGEIVHPAVAVAEQMTKRLRTAEQTLGSVRAERDELARTCVKLRDLLDAAHIEKRNAELALVPLSQEIKKPVAESAEWDRMHTRDVALIQDWMKAYNQALSSMTVWRDLVATTPEDIPAELRAELMKILDPSVKTPSVNPGAPKSLGGSQTTDLRSEAATARPPTPDGASGDGGALS